MEPEDLGRRSRGKRALRPDPPAAEQEIISAYLISDGFHISTINIDKVKLPLLEIIIVSVVSLIPQNFARLYSSRAQNT